MGMYGDQADFGNQSMGATFPTNHRAGRVYWRRDLGIWCWDDGTDWLGPEFELDGWTYYPGAEVGEQTVTQEYMNTALRQDFATRITRIAYYGFINGATNGGSYKMHLRTFTGLVDLQSSPINTSSWSATTWAFPADVTTINNQPAVNAHGLQWYIEKIGTPSPLRWFFAVYGRLVIT